MLVEYWEIVNCRDIASPHPVISRNKGIIPHVFKIMNVKETLPWNDRASFDFVKLIAFFHKNIGYFNYSENYTIIISLLV
jgi:hypothetical protein